MLVVFLLLVNDLHRLIFPLRSCYSCSWLYFCIELTCFYLHKHYRENLAAWLIMFGFKFDSILIVSLCRLITYTWRVILLLMNNKIFYRIIEYKYETCPTCLLLYLQTCFLYQRSQDSQEFVSEVVIFKERKKSTSHGRKIMPE